MHFQILEIALMADIAVKAIIHVDHLNMAIMVKLPYKGSMTAVAVVMFSAENITILPDKFCRCMIAIFFIGYKI